MPSQTSDSTRNPDTALPVIETDLDRAGVLDRLARASRRGRLPGYTNHVENAFFRVAAFGVHFDRQLLAHDETGDGYTRIRFRSRLPLKAPAILAVALLLSVEPGRYFLDQLIPGEWGWIDTRWWYYPLSILPIPWIWRKVMGQNLRAAMASAREMIEKIAKELDGRLIDES